MIDGIVADEPVEGLPGAVVDTLMDTPEARARVAAASWSLQRRSDHDTVPGSQTRPAVPPTPRRVAATLARLS